MDSIKLGRGQQQRVELARGILAKSRPPGHHGGSAYQVSYAAGKLRAFRRDGGAGLPAGSAEDLHDLIVADYEARKVPREFDVPAQ
jgi:hypothetical protein